MALTFYTPPEPARDRGIVNADFRLPNTPKSAANRHIVDQRATKAREQIRKGFNDARFRINYANKSYAEGRQEDKALKAQAKEALRELEKTRIRALRPGKNGMPNGLAAHIRYSGTKIGSKLSRLVPGSRTNL